MSSTGKIALIAGAIGLAIYLVKAGKQTITDWAEKITVKLHQFGKPVFQSNQLSIPLILRISNPSPLQAPIQSVAVRLFFLRNGMYQPFGYAPPTQPFYLNAQGTTDVAIQPVIDVAKLNPFTGSTSVSSLINNLNNLITGNNPLIDIKLEFTIMIEGYEVVQSATTKLYLNQLLNAA